MDSALYIVATPIGNMGDITRRAIETLASVDFVACEDTRVGGKLLMILGIKKPLVSYYEHNKAERGMYIIERVKSGESCALVTDAGTPAISDPGADLVRLCNENDVRVVPIPGACAAITAFCASGITEKRFVFEGFLPESKKERVERLKELKAESRPFVIYSAPHDVKKDIADLIFAFGERDAFVGRELTKLNESFYHGTLTSFAEMIERGDIPERGEFVLIICGAPKEAEKHFWDDMSISDHAKYYIESGMTKSAAAKAVASDRGIAKSDVYDTIK